MAQPTGPLVRRVGQQQEDQGRRAEQDQGEILVVLGQGHVGGQNDGQQQDPVDSPVIAEDIVRGGLGCPPDQDPNDQAEMPDLESRRLMPPRQVEVCLRYRRCGRVKPASQSEGSAGQRRPDGLDDDECPDGAAHGLGKPGGDVQPGAEIAPRRGDQSDPDDEGCQAVLPEHPAGIREGPRHRRGQDQNQRQGDPSLVGAQTLDELGHPPGFLDAGRLTLRAIDIRAIRSKPASGRHS